MLEKLMGIFLSELFFLGSEMDLQQKTVLESFCSLQKILQVWFE